MKKKALFFDIDGTIWNGKNEIPPSTIEAIRTARGNGHLAFLNTGRTRSFMQNEKLLSIGFDGIVSGCGTLIEYQERIIFYKELETELVEHTLGIVRKYGLRPILEGKDYLYMDYEEFCEDPYGRKVMAEMGENLLGIAEEWGKWKISKFSCATEEADQESCYAALEEYYDFKVHDIPVVEMVPKGFDKGTGIMEVCRLLEIDIADTYAFGDSVNDLEMLRAAGVGICMGNGSDLAKEASDYITTPMEEDGIWNACRHFGLI